MLSTLVNVLNAPESVDVIPWGIRIYTTILILWGATWFLAAYNYGKASHSSWIDQGGKYRRSFQDLFKPYLFGWKYLFRKVDYEGKPVREVPSRYTVGHYLRFSIFLGAISPIIMAILSNPRDKGAMSWLGLSALCLILLVSTAGAVGHLYVAYRMNPSAWTRLIIFSTLWVLFGPLLFTLINWP